MVADRTLYDILDVDPTANQETISKVCKNILKINLLELEIFNQAVKAKSREHHPDRGGKVEMVKDKFQFKRYIRLKYRCKKLMQPKKS